ncbi:calcium/calmodulin-dependent protein kinase type IV-like [Schistocerca americana]|uniref:calcium/calmodulin-dependent protein kinase type IV-like n=1 Tax=Schistocerca americana TaxID=7009 RepID=UPI001F4FC227|nr:calcium/calmodulin-dependent protein kinase type IV-like [Schistocerca americana]
MSETKPLQLDVAAQQPWLPEQAGKRLEDCYILGDVIGRGASSTVYKCLYKGKKEYACKVINKTRLVRSAAMKQLPILRTLRHPNIVQLRDVLETESEVQLVAELMSGGELLERLAGRGHYSERDAAAAVRQLLSALQYLHGSGVVHGDLKPEHLLFESEDENSCLKMTDHGLNHLLQKRHPGFPRSYSAPEVLLNKGFGPPSDIWSLGVIMYIMLCGFEPYWNDSSEAERDSYMFEPPNFTSPLWEEVSDSAKELITQLLHVDPSSRLSAEEALNHPWVQGESGGYKHLISTVKRLQEFNAKRKFRVATCAVLATQRALHLISPERKQKNKIQPKNTF